MYLGTTSLSPQPSTRTHSISMTRSTLPLDEPQEDPMAQEVQAGPEGQTILTEDRSDQPLFPPLILFPSNPPETSDRLGYLPYSSTAIEPELTPLSESFGFT